MQSSAVSCTRVVGQPRLTARYMRRVPLCSVLDLSQIRFISSSQSFYFDAGGFHAVESKRFATMDSSTAAAIAAVAIAVLAFVVALAQVLQQYFVTGSLLRLCDSTVYGSLPGRGRRIWQTNQFRFRVVYTLPQLRLERGFWDVDYHDGVELHEYPVLSEWSDWKRPPPGLITAVYASVKKNTLRAQLPMGRILRKTIRKSRRLFHRFMQTSVAQSSFGRIPNSLHHRGYTIFQALLSSLRQSIHGNMAKSRTPSVSSEIRPGLARGINPDS